jgi:hypothetical protein
LGHEPISNQSSTNQGKSARASLDLSVLPEALSRELWREFVANRKAMKRPISTQTAVNGIARDLRACESEGIASNDALTLAIEKGWQGVKPAWVKNALSDDPLGRNQLSAPAYVPVHQLFRGDL